jgi:inhibitor of KinA
MAKRPPHLGPEVPAEAAPSRRFPVFTPVAEHSLLVEFGDRIDPAVNARVLGLDAALASHPFAGFLEAIPAYASLLVRFDPLVTDHGAARAHVQTLLHKATAPLPAPALHEVTVCYDGDLAPDLAAVAEATGLTMEEVIAAHLSGRYAVFMYGFAPGYAYLAGVPEAIRLPRKPAAVRGIAAGSVLIAGPQCLVSTLTMPTGWWVIGRSSTPILQAGSERPFRFDVGDRVRFKRISRAQHEAGGAG